MAAVLERNGVTVAGWLDVGALDDIAPCGARVVETSLGNVAVFRTDNDGLFALRDSCPHMGGPLSDGIVHGEAVTCPLHNWVISLRSGEALGTDEGCTGAIDVEVRAGRVLLRAESVRRALA